MSVAAPTSQSVMTAEYVNPILVATKTVFEMMLGCTPNRTGLALKAEPYQSHEVSAVIGISGSVAGTIVVSLSKQAACSVLARMLGEEVDDINHEVCDAVGELTNMIAGKAKSLLERHQLSLSLPNVVSGPDHVVHYPSEIQPLVISFDSEIGPFSIEVGFSGL